MTNEGFSIVGPFLGPVSSSKQSVRRWRMDAQNKKERSGEKRFLLKSLSDLKLDQVRSGQVVVSPSSAALLDNVLERCIPSKLFVHPFGQDAEGQHDWSTSVG